MTDSERIDQIEEGMALLAFRAQNWQGIDRPEEIPGMQAAFRIVLQAIADRVTQRRMGGQRSWPAQVDAELPVIGTITDM